MNTNDFDNLEDISSRQEQINKLKNMKKSDTMKQLS